MSNDDEIVVWDYDYVILRSTLCYPNFCINFMKCWSIFSVLQMRKIGPELCFHQSLPFGRESRTGSQMKSEKSMEMCPLHWAGL